MSDPSARQGYIGGSDWTHLLGIEPYGCPRRLVYQKRGFEPDYPEQETNAMQRGTELEPVIVSYYCRETGAKRTRGRKPRSKSLPAWWQGHSDAIVRMPDGSCRVIEAKTAGYWIWKQIGREGIHLGYVCQAHHYMALHDLSNADIYVCWPDGWKFRTFAVQRDEDLLTKMREAGESFMRAVEFGPFPPQLDPKDKRCQNCPWRVTCHGSAVTEAAPEAESGLHLLSDQGLVALCREEREAAAVNAEAEALLEVCREKLRLALGTYDAVEVPGFRVYHREVRSSRLDAKAMERDHPDWTAAYRRDIITRPLRVIALRDGGALTS